MKQFESRNVLDRIETTWNMFFSSQWQVRVLPQILMMAGWSLSMLLSLSPLFFLIDDLMGWGNLTYELQLFLIAKVLIVLLIPISIYTIMSGMIYTYTLTISHDFERDKTWQEYLKIAWSRLWWWAWYGLWVTIFIILLLAIWGVLYFLSPNIFFFSFIIIFALFLWSIIAIYVWAPWYILANTWSPRWLIWIFWLTFGRWWRILGNALLGSMIVSSVLSLFQQFIFSIIWLGSIGDNIVASKSIDFSAIVSQISPDSVTRWFLGLLLISIMTWWKQAFIWMFQYVVWKDITTDKPEEEIKETE